MLGTQSDLDQTLSNLIFNSQNNVLYGSTELSISKFLPSSNDTSGMKSVSPGSYSKILKSNFFQTLACFITVLKCLQVCSTLAILTTEILNICSTNYRDQK